jgi:hypothetical protein
MKRPHSIGVSKQIATDADGVEIDMIAYRD